MNSSEKDRGLYGKFSLHHTDLSDPVDPSAFYFVLRLDNKPVDRAIAWLYAQAVEGSNPTLASDLKGACYFFGDRVRASENTSLSAILIKLAEVLNEVEAKYPRKLLEVGWMPITLLEHCRWGGEAVDMPVLSGPKPLIESLEPVLEETTEADLNYLLDALGSAARATLPDGMIASDTPEVDRRKPNADV